MFFASFSISKPILKDHSNMNFLIFSWLIWSKEWTEKGALFGHSSCFFFFVLTLFSLTDLLLKLTNLILERLNLLVVVFWHQTFGGPQIHPAKIDNFLCSRIFLCHHKSFVFFLKFLIFELGLFLDFSGGCFEFVLEFKGHLIYKEGICFIHLLTLLVLFSDFGLLINNLLFFLL